MIVKIEFRHISARINFHFFDNDENCRVLISSDKHLNTENLFFLLDSYRTIRCPSIVRKMPEDD